MEKGDFYIINMGTVKRTIAKITKKPIDGGRMDFIYARTAYVNSEGEYKTADEGGYFRYRFTEGIKLFPQVS